MVYLARGLDRLSVPTALVVQPGSPSVGKARDAGLKVYELSMKGEADLTASFRIARLARGRGFNILHSHTAHAHSLIAMASRFWGAGCKIVSHRRIEYAVGKSLFGLGKLKYLFGVDAYVAISNRVKQTLMDVGVPDWKIFIVRSSTDPSRFLDVPRNMQLRRELGVPDDAFLVGNIGALVGHKDHRTLLEACRIVRDRIPDTWVMIVGDGPLASQIHEKARALQMDDRLVMTGFRWDVPGLIQVFDVFALSSSEEGICGSLIDVAVSGCPIVATDAGGVREAVLPEETGIVVPIRSPRALAGGILRLAEDPDLAAQMARNGRRRVLDYFNVKRMSEKTLEIYRKVLAGEVGPTRPLGFCNE
jgi:glycosyltransferase involved in cell wall biosynthesis